ncbi:MAG: hypothetical protein AAB393_02465 [Bacteroidota bacterium]
MPKIVFRMAVPRDGTIPKKTRELDNCDYFTIVALGDKFMPIMDGLKKSVCVTVQGYTQSRDISDGRTVVETIAREIAIVVKWTGPRNLEEPKYLAVVDTQGHENK